MNEIDHGRSFPCMRVRSFCESSDNSVQMLARVVCSNSSKALGSFFVQKNWEDDLDAMYNTGKESYFREITIIILTNFSTLVIVVLQ